MASLRSNNGKTTFMDSGLFWQARNGVIQDDQLELDKILTPQRNTVLHIYITASTTDKTDFVGEILDICPALLLQANASGEIPLHLAARYGHKSIVEILIGRAKAIDDDRIGDIESGGIQAAREMLRMTTKEKDTPLHEAVRFGHLSVAKVLAKEDPCFVYPANEAGETPLYVAAERGNFDLVRFILHNCASPLASGPNNRNALHAATIGKHQDLSLAMAEEIVRKMVNLSEQADEKGWVPLHYAADLNRMTIVEILLSFNKYALYIGDLEDKTPLHIAASQGHVTIMRRMYRECPDCYELVDNRGMNALHFAVQNNNLRAIKFILKDSSLSYLLNWKDNEGNTPFHLIALPWVARTFLSNSRADTLAFNKQNKNSLDQVDSNAIHKAGLFVGVLKQRLRNGGLQPRCRITIPEDDKEKESGGERDVIESKIDKAREASLITATLIATVTFAAGFSMPGSYVTEKGPDLGTPTLKKNGAFQIFIVMNTISFVLSSFAVIFHLFMPLRKKLILFQSIVRSNLFIFYAMGAMVLAFGTAMYAVLETPLALLSTFVTLIVVLFLVFVNRQIL